MPPAAIGNQQNQLGLSQMEVEINSPESTTALTSNWVSFSEKGISHDLNRTLDSMKIQTAFRIDGKLVKMFSLLKGTSIEFLLIHDPALLANIIRKQYLLIPRFLVFIYRWLIVMHRQNRMHFNGCRRTTAAFSLHFYDI